MKLTKNQKYMRHGMGDSQEKQEGLQVWLELVNQLINHQSITKIISAGLEL